MARDDHIPGSPRPDRRPHQRGVYLLLERNLTRMLLGLLLIGNAINLLILIVGGPSGNPPIRGRTSDGATTTADPLAQGMILTAIVITMGIAAFVLALAYRSYRLTTAEEVSDDPEDARVSQLAAKEAGALDEDRPRARRGPRHRPPDELDALPGHGGVAMTTSRRSVLMPLPVLIPMVGCGATLFAGRRPRLQRASPGRAVGGRRGVRGAGLPHRPRRHARAACRRLGADGVRHGAARHHAGGGSAVGTDALVSSIVLLAVVFYAIGQGIRDGDERQPVSIFLPTYLVLSAGVCTAFLAGDLFNLFVGFEVLLSASFVLLTIGASKDRVRAGIAYVMVSMVSSLIFLFGIALVYAADRHIEHGRARGAARRRDRRHPDRAVRGTAGRVRHQGGGVPAFDLAADSYPTAPAPVTAVFAGLLTKVGVYAIIRAHSLLFPSGGSIRSLVAALLTMLVGILGAIAQSDIKRLLSFTLVSHIGYMVFGIALSSQLGMSGAIYYVAHHILVQTTLFLVVGLIERQAGASTLQRLGGLAAASPLLAFCSWSRAQSRWHTAVSGFIGKVALLEAGAQDGSGLAWVLVGGSVLTSLLTLYVVARVWTKAFWRAREDAPEGHLSAAAPRCCSTSPRTSSSSTATRWAGCRSGCCLRRAR